MQGIDIVRVLKKMIRRNTFNIIYIYLTSNKAVIL